MASQTFNISFDEALLKRVDEAAKLEYASRSDFLRAAALSRLEERASHGSDTQAQDHFNQVMATADQLLQQYEADFKHLADR